MSKVLLEIKDGKLDFVLEILSHFKYVKAKTISKGKAESIEGLKQAVEDVKLAKEGKLKLNSARDLLNEL